MTNDLHGIMVRVFNSILVNDIELKCFDIQRLDWLATRLIDVLSLEFEYKQKGTDIEYRIYSRTSGRTIIKAKTDKKAFVEIRYIINEDYKLLINNGLIKICLTSFIENTDRISYGHFQN